MKDNASAKRRKYQVLVLPPLRKIRLKRVWHEYSLYEKEYSNSNPVDFELRDIDLSRYASTMYTGDSLADSTAAARVSKTNVDYLQNNMRYSELSLAAEVARYLNISCVLAAKILRESEDGIELILETVNRYNQAVYDVIIPAVFKALFAVAAVQRTEDKEIVLLREPSNAGYYEFLGREDLAVMKDADNGFTPAQIDKSFHADIYCFDSQPEKKCFEQYIASDKVKEVYFTGMFTAGQGDLSVYYYDPEAGRLRQYYPDFLAKMADGSYQLIEVKGDNMIDNSVVKAKAEAAREMAAASGVEYIMYASSDIMSGNIII